MPMNKQGRRRWRVRGDGGERRMIGNSVLSVYDKIIFFT